jgi:two-component system, sensor histidine kinase and response regulator
MSIAPRARLLIVDDEVAQMNALCDTLGMEGYATTGVVSATRALATLQPGGFDILITDLQMPDMDGIALLQAARAIDPTLDGIVMTGHGAIDTAVAAMKSGALDYILKPFKLATVVAVLERALELRRLRTLNEQLREHVEQRTRELESANKDLESFAYSVSHDLRAPLRAMQGYCQILQEDFGATLDSEAGALLSKSLDSSHRMEQLIADLLCFSRFSLQELVKRPVSMSALVQRVLAGMPARDDPAALQVRVAALPDCSCDPSLMEQVLVNLIGNAVKFSRHRSPALIDIGGQQSGSEVSYFVRDNGAGFDMQYAARLFGVFQRLHSQEAFEGTGIGLGIVKRIVERHGGRVWAQAEKDVGATFAFALPA